MNVSGPHDGWRLGTTFQEQLHYQKVVVCRPFPERFAVSCIFSPPSSVPEDMSSVCRSTFQIVGLDQLGSVMWQQRTVTASMLVKQFNVVSPPKKIKAINHIIYISHLICPFKNIFSWHQFVLNDVFLMLIRETIFQKFRKVYMEMSIVFSQSFYPLTAL